MSGAFRITLAAARVNAGLTQKDVCRTIGMTEKTLVNWESGKTMPSVDNAQKLCALYGVKLDDINFLPKRSN